MKLQGIVSSSSRHSLWMVMLVGLLTVPAAARQTATTVGANAPADRATQIFVVGDTTLAELVPVLEKSFGVWKSAADPATSAKAFDVASPAPKPRIILIDRPKSP